MSRVATIRDWGHGHHAAWYGFAVRMGLGVHHVVHDERFWWVMLALGILLAFALLIGLSMSWGVPVEWLRSVPPVIYPYVA
jgi:hypothetical protein